MGLDCSHDAFHGAYSAFNRFRQAIAKAIGGSYPPHEDKELDEKQWYWSNEADVQKYPGLRVFFNHEDCEGDIAPTVASQIADEMESLLPELDAMGMGAGHIELQGGYGKVARRFIAGCRKAADRQELLTFG